MSAEISVNLRVNGTKVSRTVEARRRLGDFLREDLGLTGTHLSCEHGVCGVCTVVVDGKPRLSCLTLVAQLDGLSVETVESLAPAGALSALQEAFWDKHALQCGYCTPGFLMALTDLFRRTNDPSDDQIKEVIDGIVCRCTGYVPIFEAAVAVREKLRKSAA
jgi:aerobic-type carbon monoxide dehydrogenase small subunit (CoxS/CutS family)